MFGRGLLIGPIELLALPLLITAGPKLLMFVYTGAVLVRAF